MAKALKAARAAKL